MVLKIEGRSLTEKPATLGGDIGIQVLDIKHLTLRYPWDVWVGMLSRVAETLSIDL